MGARAAVLLGAAWAALAGAARSDEQVPGPASGGRERPAAGEARPGEPGPAEGGDVLLAAGVSLGANLAIFSYDRWVERKEWARVDLASWKRNLRSRWVLDPNDFFTNQVGHPYHGSLSFAAARASGLGFWSSLAFPAGASALWELFAETEPPSLNDQITTSVGGAFLGEALFRLSADVLDAGGGRPPWWREALAAAIAPTAGLARALQGSRRPAPAPEPIPHYIEARLGGSLGGHASDPAGRSDTSGLLALRLQVLYGIPDRTWRFRRPFDHHQLEASVVMARGVSGALFIRGLLAGGDFGAGPRSGGLWGLWGNFDTATPDSFRVSSSGLALGGVWRWAGPEGIVLTATGTAGLGFGAAGTRVPDAEGRDYHFGLATTALAELRLVAGGRGMLRAAGRQYFLGGFLSADPHGSERVSHATADALLRVIGRHCLGLELVLAYRGATYADRRDTYHRYSQLLLVYALASDAGLGAGG